MSSLPLIEAAARGSLPPWAQLSEHRHGHVRRVAELLGQWAEELDLTAPACTRWRAAGLLHDALREVAPAQLRPLVPEPLRDLPGKLLHGPAAAARLRAEGVSDESLLCAITYHTIGHPELDELGRALFIADYIEPGRRYDADLLASLRERMPRDRHDVLPTVLRARLRRLIEDDRPIRAETAAFWNAITAAAEHEREA
ncbi:MAG TPA: HD domain-containing protein [Longimicrobiales bacterium]|nr:HD domain-containing protein [Longimicrobiales bacterium]